MPKPENNDPSIVEPRLYSRPGNDRRFPLIVDALARLRSRSCIIDGEAVACDALVPSTDADPNEALEYVCGDADPSFKSDFLAHTQARLGFSPVRRVGLADGVVVARIMRVAGCAPRKAVAVDAALTRARQTGRETDLLAPLRTSQEIDRLGDPSATDGERQRRKRSLKGPKEFRDVRGDRPKFK